MLAAFAALKSIFPQILLVLVPRHPERFGTVARHCRRAGNRVVRRTDRSGDLPGDVEVVIGDTMGELQKLYAAADVAFIGGSLVRVGGHNILEACAVGVPVIFGPHMFQAEQISGLALASGAAQQVTDVAGLVDAVTAYIREPGLRESAGAAARALVAENRGALQQTLELIERTLQQRTGAGVPRRPADADR